MYHSTAVVKFSFGQECIPVGCVPSAAVAVSPGGGRSAWTKCMLGYQPPWSRHPPRPGSLGARSRPPLLETFCKAYWDTTCNACWDSTPPPRDLLQGMLGYHLQGMLGYHPPPRGQTHTCKNITFATSLWTVINLI